MLAADSTVYLPEIADYEVRRSFLLEGLLASIRRLDLLKANLTYLPLSTSMMLKAAELWADARRRGVPTADPKELDADAILAAQALAVGGVVVTENVGHLARFVEARDWTEITPGA
jgi:predicted nucleic acid-binding protein